MNWKVLFEVIVALLLTHTKSGIAKETKCDEYFDIRLPQENHIRKHS